MANVESTALRESDSESTATRSLSTIKWEIEPRLRVTPGDSLSSLNELIVRPRSSSSFTISPPPSYTRYTFLLCASFILTTDSVLMHSSISPIQSFLQR
jgi:hypothetical protein